MGAALDDPLMACDGQAYVNPLIAAVACSPYVRAETSDVEAALTRQAPPAHSSSAHAPSARLAAFALLAHAAAFWGLFLGARQSEDPTAPTAAALAYEATAGLTFFILACLWVWSRLAGRRETATPTTTSPFRLSIPALAALFVLQWGAFSFLLLSACCK